VREEPSDRHPHETAVRIRSTEEREGLRDLVVMHLYRRAHEIAGEAVSYRTSAAREADLRVDRVITSPWLGLPLMLGLLCGVFWLTIVGANYPSELLTRLFSWLGGHLGHLSTQAGLSPFYAGLLVSGVYRSVSWVVSVMLPPMAIFFPLFTLLEDLGYLPRVAFTLDRLFSGVGAHGKQALTMSMGFGCNAAGVVACRIISSPRERLIAQLTNTFVPCNGRFPLLIALSVLFWNTRGSVLPSSFSAAVVVSAVVAAGVGATLLVSWVLARTLLRGVPSGFVLELPPYRPPQVLQVLTRSLLDRTLFVLGRAVVVAAPAGALTWLCANLSVAGLSWLEHLVHFLEPAGQLLGMDGHILVAFILALPANELVLPILLMSYTGGAALTESGGLGALKAVLLDHGWTRLTAACTMAFSLLHYPCGTTIYTIYRETRSGRWTSLGVLLPLAVAVLVCWAMAAAGRAL